MLNFSPILTGVDVYNWNTDRNHIAWVTLMRIRRENQIKRTTEESQSNVICRMDDVSSSDRLQSLSIDVSIIVPVYNGEQWLEECLQSVVAQNFTGSLEVSIFNDGSTDGTSEILAKYLDQGASCSRMKWTIGSEPNEAEPGGVGYAKNRAVQQSSGQFLCFLDADDVMLEDRVQLQYEAALACENRLCLIGSRFIREPKDSTIRYSRWANDLSSRQLYDQAYTSHGPTVIAPTWFMSRALYDAVGGFQEEPRRGYPEDLDFFYRGLAVGAELKKVECELTIYRYHRTSASFGVSEETIWQLRVCQFQTNVLNKWPHFTIWNAGKQGKKFYKSLTKDNQEKVVAFCDVDSKKLAQKVYEQYDAESRTITARVPIISYQMARPPAVICVKLDMTDGALEGYLRDLCWTEGVHYFHLS